MMYLRTLLTTTPSDDLCCMVASEARAAFVADVLGVEPPARLVDEENCPSPEIMDFVRRTGASLDFIFMGDLRGIIRAAYEAGRGK